jgi:polyphenol oxidase
MHTWHWRTWQDLPYLTCTLLEDFAHGFFTQQFSPRSPLELTTVLDTTAQPYRVKQVHGDRVLTPDEIDQGLKQIDQQIATPDAAVLMEADGVLTDQVAQSAWACSADCVPALIADVQTGQVAAVHAGWRGTAMAIVPQAIARFQAHGSQLDHLRVALGPAIAGEVYQVSTTVAATVGMTILPTPELVGSSLKASTLADSIPSELLSVETIASALATLRQLPNSPILADPQPGRVKLDVRRVNFLQLTQAGLQPEQVAIAPYCTYQTPEHFFSYRRDRLKKVQWSGIVSRRAAQ